MENREIAHSNLSKFVGTWHTEGQIVPTANHAAIDIKGTDTYEWLPGEFFLLHKIDVHMGDDHSQGIEIIGFAEALNHYTMQHYNSKGDSGQMTATFMDDTWIFKGESLLFRGGFSENDTVFSGIWEQLNQEKVWAPYMHIKLVRA